MSDRFVQVDPRAFSGDNDFADIMTNGSTTPRRSLFCSARQKYPNNLLIPTGMSNTFLTNITMRVSAVCDV